MRGSGSPVWRVTGPWGAGSIVSSGAVAGSSAGLGASVAGRRAAEVRDGAEVKSPWLKAGQQLRLEALDRTGQSVFGAIEQTVVSMSDDAPAGSD